MIMNNNTMSQQIFNINDGYAKQYLEKCRISKQRKIRIDLRETKQVWIYIAEPGNSRIILSSYYEDIQKIRAVRATYLSPTSSLHVVEYFCCEGFADCFSLERVWLVIFHLNSDRNKVIRASVRTRNLTSGTNFRPVWNGVHHTGLKLVPLV